MPSLTNSNDGRAQHGRGARPSASPVDERAYQAPPVEPGTVTRVIKPDRIRPSDRYGGRDVRRSSYPLERAARRARAAARELRRATAEPTARDQKARAVHGLMDVGKFLARRSPLAAAFGIGWEIGDFLFPSGATVTTGNPVDAQGWSPLTAGWVWYDGCHTTGHEPASIVLIGGFAVGNPCQGVAPSTWTEPAPNNNAGEAFDNWNAIWDNGFAPTSMSRPAVDVATGLGTDKRTEMWYWEGVGAAEHPHMVPGVGVPLPMAQPWPSEAPDLAPMHVPTQMPFAQSWSDASPKHPWEEPTTKSATRPHASSVVPIVSVPRVTIMRPSPAVPTPPTVPPQVIVVPPDGPPRGEVPRQPPRPPGKGNPRARGGRTGGRKPPKKGVKEKKLSVRNAKWGLPAAWIFLNGVTEANDLINAMYAALPDECKIKGKATPYAKAKAVYDCFDHLDEDYFQRMITELINNEFEDFVWGTIGRRIAKVQGKLGPTGLSRALREQQNIAEDAVRPEGERNPALLPELAYTPGVGWTVTWEIAGVFNADFGR